MSILNVMFPETSLHIVLASREIEAYNHVHV